MVFFKSYPPNESGYDFVVGDLYGHWQRLLDELARQGFDKEKDRLFCTVDLIDRGPDSFGALMLIFEPWFHFVRGNHEDDLPLFLVDENDMNQVEAMLWSRRLLREIPHADLRDHGLYLAAHGQEFEPNVGLPFVGHNVVERPTLFRSHLFVDTGMGTIPGGRLTVLRVQDVHISGRADGYHHFFGDLRGLR